MESDEENTPREGENSDGEEEDAGFNQPEDFYEPPEGEDGEGEEAVAAPPAGGAAAAAAAAAPKKRGGIRGPRQIAIPTDSASFFRARKRDVKAFTFTPEGDLQVPEMRGQPAKVIPLPSYRPATIAELKEADETRKGFLAGVEREMDELQHTLKEAIAEWRLSGATAEVLRIQRDLARLDAQRTAQVTPLRWTTDLKGLRMRQVLFGPGVEDKALGSVATMLRTRPHLFTETLRPRQPGEEVAAPEGDREGGAAAAAGEAAAGEPETFVFFYEADDPEHGKLSPDTMVEFVYNETKYTSLWQAYEIERITALGRKDARKLLLRTTSPKKLRALAGVIRGNVEDPRALWIGILTALVSQRPEFGEVLRATGQDTLVFADPKDEVSGIGLSAEDERATDRASWKGKNLLGQAWTAVRSGLPPEGEELGSQSGGGYTEHGMTQKEREEERGNVLIGLARRRQGAH